MNFSATTFLSAENTEYFGSCPFDFRIIPFNVQPEEDFSPIAIYYDFGDGTTEFVEYATATENVVDTDGQGYLSDVNDPRNYGKTHTYRTAGTYVVNVAIYNNGTFAPDLYTISVHVNSVNVYDYYEGVKILKVSNDSNGKVIMVFEGIRGEQEDIFIQKLE
jgi:hypothetical protein